MKPAPWRLLYIPCYRRFSTTAPRLRIEDISRLPERTYPTYHGLKTEHPSRELEWLTLTESKNNDLLSLRWPSPLQNVLLVRKETSSAAMTALIEFARHIMTTYPSVSLIAEPHLAAAVHNDLSTPLYTTKDTSNIPLHSKTDLVATFGGDGTILRASALFSTATSVPPILSFSMGTLGFLGEWKFDDYKRAFREAYMSGAPGTGSPSLEPLEPLPHAINPSDNGPHGLQNGWAILRGKSLGSNRSARVLLRHRLKVGIFESTADQNERINGAVTQHAMNEVLLHRGTHPHLTHITVLVNGRFLTEAVGDGMLISTPTGSTAYSLSAGGSIIHPLVPSLLLTPICPRSLSFRPLVLPANVEVTLRMGLKNRSKEVEVTVDGVRRPGGMSAGMELRVIGEEVLRGDSGWTGGVPCLMKGGQTRGDDSWVGGLNGLLKFNYPFGEED